MQELWPLLLYGKSGFGAEVEWTFAPLCDLTQAPDPLDSFFLSLVVLVSVKALVLGPDFDCSITDTVTHGQQLAGKGSHPTPTSCGDHMACQSQITPHPIVLCSEPSQSSYADRRGP